ncbi:YciI family protein [Roseateles amylovorans]|uniref:YciI family protein n=1 Tax=Roseateles amylovorans TaxID=2978473 RepID=A0ABY6AXU5_9BURK|nr:YciI family protein [Roseateles amylovorans]UXH78016.1 YciI family protein [Roseateles amylovorans]
MSYILLINEPVGQREARTPEEGQASYARMTAFAEQLQAQGLLHSAQSLQSVNGATRLTKREGRVSTVDGPFAEAKEMVGGFFWLKVDTREAALAIARECPAAEWCTVEVRALAPCHEESKSG